MYTVTISHEAIRKNVINNYSNIEEVLIRELLQNSLDAGANAVTFQFGKDWYTCFDDGAGMSKEDFIKVFGEMRETTKTESGKIGGFGAGRDALVYFPHQWEVRTRDYEVIGKGNTFEEPEDKPMTKGFIISAVDDYYKELDLSDALYKVMQHSYLPTTKVTNDGRHVGEGRWNIGLPFKQLDFCTIYAYDILEYEEELGMCYVRAGGLFMYSFRVGGPFVFYVELNVPSTEVMQENRQGFKWEYKDQIDKALQGWIVRRKAVAGELPRLTRYIPAQLEITQLETTMEEIEIETEMRKGKITIETYPEYLEAKPLTDNIATYMDEPTIEDFQSYGKVLIDEKKTDEDFEFIVIGDNEPNMDTIKYAKKLGELMGVRVIPGQAEETQMIYHMGENYLLVGTLPQDKFQRYDTIISEFSMASSWYRSGYTETVRRKLFAEKLNLIEEI